MKTKYKIFIALTLLVVFGLGVTAGVLGERYFVHKKYRRPQADRQSHPTLDSWARELQLTPDQQEKIREIFKKNEERMKAYWSEGTNRLQEIRKTLKEEIDALLTPEQKKKMEEIIRRNDERRKNEPDRYNPNRNDPRERREPDRQPPDREK
jgi:Spy/CpxP family protein refolding chaperone